MHRTRATALHEQALFLPRRWFARSLLGPALAVQNVAVSEKAAVLLQGVAESLMIRLLRLARRLSEHHSVHPATERRLEPGDLRLVCAMRLGWHRGDANVDTGLASGVGGGVARSQQVWSAQGKQHNGVSRHSSFVDVTATSRPRRRGATSAEVQYEEMRNLDPRPLPVVAYLPTNNAPRRTDGYRLLTAAHSALMLGRTKVKDLNGLLMDPPSDMLSEAAVSRLDRLPEAAKTASSVRGVGRMGVRQGMACHVQS